MSEMWAKVRAGRRLDGEVLIDCHAHMGPWCAFHIPGDPWSKGMLAWMDMCGVAKVACAAHAGIGPDCPWANELVADAVAGYPERFIGYTTVNPHYGEQELVEEMERHQVRGNHGGIKLHPAVHDYPVDGPAYRAAWAFAHDHELPVLVHTWERDKNCAPSMHVPIARQYPGAKILLGHSGGTAGGIDEAIEAARQCDNIHLDLCASRMPRGMIERMVAIVGSERVLFGTDIPFIDGRSKIAQIAASKISDEDKRRVFGLNALRLFGLQG